MKHHVIYPIYMITCEEESCQQKEKLKQKYKGETERSLKDRICKHLGYIRNKNKSQATGYHFNLLGHSQYNFKVTILEKVMKTSSLQKRKGIISHQKVQLILPRISLRRLTITFYNCDIINKLWISIFKAYNICKTYYFITLDDN